MEPVHLRVAGQDVGNAISLRMYFGPDLSSDSFGYAIPTLSSIRNFMAHLSEVWRIPDGI